MKLIQCILLFAMTTAWVVAAPPATTTAVTQPTAADLQVQEWAVFVIDGASGQLNPDGIVNATLPAFVSDKRYGSASAPAPAVTPPVNGRRVFINGMLQSGAVTPHSAAQSTTDMDLPSPVGVIRLIGSSASKVDVSIKAKGGTFSGSYPKAADRSGELLWRDLSVLDAPPGPLSITSPGNWFSILRSVKSAYVSLEHVGSDKFLIYDVQMPYASPVQVKADADFSIQVGNTSGASLHGLTLYQGEKEGWRTVYVGDLTASDHPAVPTTSPTVAGARKSNLGVSVTSVASSKKLAAGVGYTDTTGVYVRRVTAHSPADGVIKVGDILIEINAAEVGTAAELRTQVTSAVGDVIKVKVFRDGKISEMQLSLTGRPIAATAPVTTRPTTASASSIGKTFELKVGPTTQPAGLADSWKPRMTQAGVDPADAGLMCRVIEQYAFDAHRLTAVYQMDEAEFDRMLPLEVVPQPAGIKRFGLVIIVNADPSKGTVVDDLISQMGDNDWAKRDTAYHALASMGPAATSKLKAAIKSSDLEIAWRAERLLAMAGVK